jgi:nitrous oxidase accessory protein
MSCFRLSLVLVLTFSGLAGKVLLIGPDREYRTMKSAIAAAAPGDTLQVHGGVYAEGNLPIAISLTLIGVDRPVLDGRERDEILTVTAPEFSIEGFVIRNAGASFIHDNAGIKLDGVRQGRIANNRFENNFFAIYLARTSGCTIENNEIVSSLLTETRSGNGIHLWYCKENLIRNNTIRGHRDGIYFEFVEDTKIVNNWAQGNLRYGLHFMFSNRNRYWGNTFIDNGAGVAVMYSRNIEMHDNTFKDNWGDAAYGILLKEIFDSELRNNRFIRNTVGLLSESCSRIEVENNDFINNGWAVKIMASSTENRFQFNNFVGNSFDVATNSRQNYNTFNQNYWGRYQGYDLDRDGIGDVPFHPVRLFSIFVEQNEPALILLRSLFISILDLAEEQIPLLTPATLVDQQPLMRRLP